MRSRRLTALAGTAASSYERATRVRRRRGVRPLLRQLQWRRKRAPVRCTRTLAEAAPSMAAARPREAPLTTCPPLLLDLQIALVIALKAMRREELRSEWWWNMVVPPSTGRVASLCPVPKVQNHPAAVAAGVVAARVVVTWAAEMHLVAPTCTAAAVALMGAGYTVIRLGTWSMPSPMRGHPQQLS